MSSMKTEKRFGIIAVDKGYITLDQLFEAINMQVKHEYEEGMHKLIGTILLELGHMSVPQLDDMLKTIGKCPN